MRAPARSYRGRFAPSPTGPLHLGSVIAALGSYLDARARKGTWLVRIEDIDPARERPGAAAAILRALERLGLHWDQTETYQSRRLDAYRAALTVLTERELVYPCACTRAEIGAGPYPGTCRQGLAPGRTRRSLRVRTGAAPVRFEDRVQGTQCTDLRRHSGDFVVRRADGLFAYHLAVSVDDAWQGITDVVRGADLLEATAAQVHLQTLLGLPTPRYAHLPVAVDGAGRKLSKQNRAPAVDTGDPAGVLSAALSFLGHRPPADLAGAPAPALLAWAIGHWRLAAVDRARSRPAPESGA